MKIFKSIFISLLLIVSCFSFAACSASSEEIKGCSFNLLDNKEYEISQEYKIFSKGPTGVLTVPETYKDVKVSSIGSFSCCHEITGVVGNTYITTITRSAFGCRCQETLRTGKMKLTKVEFVSNANLRTIEEEAFFKCSKLEEIHLPQEFEKFEDGVFFGCTKLTKIYLYNQNPPTGANNLFHSGDYTHKPHENFTIYVPSEAVETYKNSSWSIYNIQAID